tara:strand:+ start:107340 stop:107702 length:363 start_codon:yes stop_codon:yes gene_type:complete
MKALQWQKSNQELVVKYPDLTQKVWAQVIKDFSLEAMEINEIEVTTLDEIYNQVYPEVTRFIKFDFNALMRLLYRIDISELAVKKQMDLMPDDTAQAISSLIVKREIQKVVLRKQFSAGI